MQLNTQLEVTNTINIIIQRNTLVFSIVKYVHVASNEPQLLQTIEVWRRESSVCETPLISEYGKSVY